MTSQRHFESRGFTLPELLIAATIGVLTTIVAGDLLISHLRSSKQAEAMERQRADWTRTSAFLESEIALSEKVITNSNNVSISTACGFDASNHQFKVGLDIRRDLPIAIYSLRPSTSGWLGDYTLWRCGPNFNSDGSYNSTLSVAPILDGLTSAGLTITASSNGKKADFTLALKGYAQSSYSQADSASTRISPLYSRPSENSLCDAANLVKLEGSATAADTLVMGYAQVRAGEDVLICGRGFGTSATGATGDNITGSDGANDILEAGDYGRATLNGMGGNDVLRGTKEADTINGGAGNDTLIGREGNDTLNGGSEQNSYLPGAGNDTVTGGGGLDIVFFSGSKASYSMGGCTKASCTISGPDGTDTLTNVEVLIFSDARIDLPEASP